MDSKILYAVTVSKSLKLLNGKLKYLNEQGYDVVTVSSPGKETKRFEEFENTNFIPATMRREISLLKDIQSLLKLVKIVSKEKPDIVNSGTPKAGLLVTVAAFLCRVPIRIYTIRGLRLETTTGFKKKILLFTEKVAAMCATHIICISPSLKNKVIELKIAPVHKIKVIRKGSSNGINIAKFAPSNLLITQEAKIQENLQVDQKDFIIGFVGRLTNDKGINEVIEVFEEVSKNRENIKLLILGDFEESDSISKQLKDKLYNNPRILFEGYQENLAPYYRIMDVFLFLSKREGFGNVVIEAASSSIPAIVGNVTGVKDTVVNNVTGFIVTRNDITQIVKKVEFLIDNKKDKIQMGKNAEKWARENFDSNFIWEDYSRMYKNLLESEGNK